MDSNKLVLVKKSASAEESVSAVAVYAFIHNKLQHNLALLQIYHANIRKFWIVIMRTISIYAEKNWWYILGNQHVMLHGYDELP